MSCFEIGAFGLFELHPDSCFSTVIGDAAFDSYDNYAMLMVRFTYLGKSGGPIALCVLSGFAISLLLRAAAVYLLVRSLVRSLSMANVDSFLD